MVEALSYILECDICREQFTEYTHRPLSLPCGHTLCKMCVDALPFPLKCPTDRMEFPYVKKINLPPTYYVLKLIGGNIEMPEGGASRE